MKNVNLLEVEDRPAPDELRFIQGLLNTIDITKGVDHLAGTAQTSIWLQRFGLATADTNIDDEDATRLREFREAVRVVLSQADEGEGVEDGARALNGLTAGVALGVRFGPSGAAEIHNRSQGIDGVLGTLLVVIIEAAAKGTWQRLKICGRDSCRWAFYDSSKNRSSNWCSMETCGNREKVARHRHKAVAAEKTG